MPTWSNIVLTALLPYVSDFATRLQLPIPLPITEAQVAGCLPDRTGKVEGFILLTNDYRFWFQDGHVQSFSVSTPFNRLQDPDLMYKYFGEVRITKSEAVASARDALRKLGYTEEMLYADLDPVVVEPRAVDGHRIARYNVKWVAPNMNITSVEMEIDATSGRPLFMYFLNRNLWRDDPVVNATPPASMSMGRRFPRSITDEAEKEQIFNRVSPLIDDAIKRLQLPFCESGRVRTMTIRDYGDEEWGHGVFRGEALLTNGVTFRFGGDATRIVELGFQAADAFYHTGHEITVRSLVGKRNLSEGQAIKIAKEWVKRFNPKVKLNKKPSIRWPNLPKNVVVPRCLLNWDIDDEMVWVEVDVESGAVKYLDVRGPVFSLKNDPKK